MIRLLRPARWYLTIACLVPLFGTTPSGQTLKATAPDPISPVNGAQLDTSRPALTIRNARGIWVPAIFNYRFEVVSAEDPSTVVVSAVVAHANGATIFVPPMDLDFDTTYLWSARPQLDGAVGPWSRTSSFTTPAAPVPSGPLSFTNVSVSSGVAVPILGGHGVMFADVTEDLRPDLYVTMNFDDPVAELFFVNQGGGGFAEAAAVRGVDDFDAGSHGAAFADVDNDGDYDLLNGATVGGIPNHVYLNVGAGFFNNVTPPSMAIRAERTRAVLAFDMDRDGDLDIFAVTGWMGSGDPPGERNELYRNDGNLQWTEVTSGALYRAPAGQGATDTDYDGDGDVDIITANRDGDLNILRNDGTGNFSSVDPDSIGIVHDAFSGVTAADIDNDGDLDLLLVGLDSRDRTIGHLYRNLGAGTFRYLRDFTDIDGFMGGFADLDNDGDLDLVFAGDDVVYLNDGSGRFSVGPTVPVGGIDDPRAIAFSDVDGDGDLDFAIGAKRSANWLVRNDKNSGNWLKVELRSAQGQAGAFGAKVRVYPSDTTTELLGLREARSNNGYLGQDDPVIHFGLGSHASVTVVVSFLDGTTRTLTDVAANQTLFVDATAP